MQAVEAIPMAHARLRRLDLRVVAGLLMMLVAVVGGSSLIQKAQARTPVLVAAGTVQPGEVITASDLRVVEVSAPAGIAYLPASARSDVVGRVAAEPLWAGKVLGPSSLSTGPPLTSGMVAFSLLLPPQGAVGGEILFCGLGKPPRAQRNDSRPSLGHGVGGRCGRCCWRAAGLSWRSLLRATSPPDQPRLCKAVVDRLTFNAHIIETGSDSCRFKKTLKRQCRKGWGLVAQKPK